MWGTYLEAAFSPVFSGEGKTKGSMSAQTATRSASVSESEVSCVSNVFQVWIT